jgi:hypothetical protein
MNSNSTAYSGVGFFWIPLGIYIKNTGLLLGQDNSTNSISFPVFVGRTAQEPNTDYYNIKLNGTGIYEIIINSGGLTGAATVNPVSNHFASSEENTLYTVVSSYPYSSGVKFLLGKNEIVNCLTTNIGTSMYIMEASVSGTSITSAGTLSTNKPLLLYDTNFIPYVQSYFNGQANSTGTFSQTTLYKYTIYNSLTEAQTIIFNIVPDLNTRPFNVVTNSNIPATISVKMISKI